MEQLLGPHFWIMTFRIFIAALLSGVIGFEREIKHQPAGFRTHLLVGIGSCLMMLLSLYGFEQYIDKSSNIRFDPARIPSYVISGIGFLGAGTILVKGVTVRGLTTAASIWVVAGIGLIVGVGMIAPALLTTSVVLLSLIFLNRIEKRMVPSQKVYILNIVLDRSCDKLNEVIYILEQNQVVISQISIEDYKNKAFGPSLKKVSIEIKKNSRTNKVEMQNSISELEFIHRIF